jgi:eukaryotic-like serine/threonine-protein kinase
VQLQRGFQLGPYKVESLLGSGGMGAVYLATDTRLDRKVAIKILEKEQQENKDALARFEKEAKAVAAISHPHIVSIYDVGIDQEIPYIVSEYLEGETLRDRLKRAALPWKKAADFGATITDALASAHAKGIIHRDLKPENIFIIADDHLKLLDFGLARLTSSEPTKELSVLPTESLTAAGIIMGTVPYMSPEQARGDIIDSRSDLFSFGCVLFEMITGRSPYSRSSPAETIAAILKEEAPRASESVSIPSELDELIARCLEKHPDSRFQSARDLSFELRQIVSSHASIPTQLTNRKPLRPSSFFSAAALIVVLVIATVAVYFWKSNVFSHSIAVLPFVNEGGDPDADYLSDGITETLINNLSRLPQLKVIARTSVFKYKGTETDPLRAGRELRVKNVLTGHVQHHGDFLVIQADLLDVQTGSQLWGQRFNRKISDVFAIQEGISREITEKLSLELTQKQEERLRKPQTQNVNAYQLYLKGRYNWNRRGPDDIKKGLDYFQQAIAADPAYARAYVGMAESYALLSQFLDPREFMPRSRAAATKALEIDPDLGEAYASLAFVKAYHDWDWAGAEQEFEKAIDLDPNYATAHHWYGLVLTALGRFRESEQQLSKAVDLDPLSLIIRVASASPYVYARDYRKSMEIAEQIFEMDPNFLPGLNLLASIYEFSGDLDKAAPIRIRMLKLYGEKSLAEEIERDLKNEGREKAFKTLTEKWIKDRPPTVPAVISSQLKDKERTLYWLEQAYERRDTEMIFINVCPNYDFLRGDPRFEKLLAGMNFPEKK